MKSPGIRMLLVVCLFVVGFVVGPAALAADPAAEHMLSLYTRSRVENPASSGKFNVVYKTVQWDARKTVVVICDMWAKHWCKGATKRGAEMAPRMNQFVSRARKKGALIVHAPSGGMELYKDHPARRRAQSAPTAADLPEGIAAGCREMESEKKDRWPIDQSDGGCDDEPRCKGSMDRHQTGLIQIHDEDAISDSGVECWNMFHQRGISNVMLVGVHTNMCVMARPFGLRNMVRFGKNVVLVRDLTDAMYNSRRRPFVNHIRGTELIVEYIEEYVCPTITSGDLLGGPASRFQEDDRPHVAVLVSDDHYDADKTLPQFAQMLRERYGCYVTVLNGQGTSNIPGTDELEAADCLVLYVRRLALPKRQLEDVQNYLKAGGALVALRTASHAFDVHGKAKEGQAEWPEFDAQVLGGNYHGHGPNPSGSDIAVVPEMADHPILTGVEPAEWHSTGSLYEVSPINEDATLLMTGSIGDSVEPITWTRSYQGGRVIYSALGHPDDFDQPQFRRLLVNMIFWAMDRQVPEIAASVKPAK